MNDADSAAAKLSELLKHPDDLEKISGLKAEFTRKKAAIDAQLKLGLKEQLQLTQSGMNALQDGQRVTNLIKEEMIRIDRLCAESQSMIKNFPEINQVAQAHRNFTAVETMKNNIESFNDRLEEIDRLLKEDEEDILMQPNLLQIHYGISQLRNIRDDAVQQLKKAEDTSLESFLLEHFKRLDDSIDDFDYHVGQACMRLIPLVQDGNTSLVVRLAIIVSEEEKFDARIKELQQAQEEFKDLASRFKSLNTGSTELRGYKDKFLEAIKTYAKVQLEESNEMFMSDPDKLEKSVRWYFNDLNTVKLGMTSLMPKKWKIFRTYIQIYHNLMYDWLKEKTEDPDITPTHMLAIVHWKDKYYEKMARLGAPVKDLEPQLPGGRDSDLVREYRQLIIDKVDQWMSQMNKTDAESFRQRSENSLDHDENEFWHTKTLSDLWRMLREQLLVASGSDLPEVTEGVTDAMFRALKTRQDMWMGLVDAELSKYSRPLSGQDGMPGLQDYLVALSNDQLVCVMDSEDKQGYLSIFKRDYESLVSEEYAAQAEQKYNSVRDGFTDLGVHCIEIFVKLIFFVDFRADPPDRIGMTEFFTASWAEGKNKAMIGQIISTYEDYLIDYSNAMPTLLKDILIEDLSKHLLIAYLGCVRNKGAKFRRQEDFPGRMREDVKTVFDFFEKHADENSFRAIKEQWRAVDKLSKLADCDKHAIPVTFEEVLETHWDVRLSWVEAVLRARDDIDFGPLGDGKSVMKNIRARAADHRAEGEPTIMSDVA